MDEVSPLARASDGGGVAAVERALTIVTAVEAAEGPLTLAELSRITGLYKSSILRLLVTLSAASYIVRLRDGRYDLGPAAFRLGIAYERKNALRWHMMPVLQDLVDRGTESASFHIRLDNENRLCTFRVNSGHATVDRVEVGGIFPLRRGAAGRVLLAYADEPGEPYDTIRAQGWALSQGERDPSCAGLAAPVFGPTGLVGALSLSGPQERFGPAEVEKMRGLMLAAARDLTRRLGGA